ncbi:MAG: indolepyruvate oxidoreductase subunit beta [Phycisphaerales bacterium]|nr:MAG: indolepyruvate oxidoreductase subunit beta [Phycisphaerales bacterium]
MSSPKCESDAKGWRILIAGTGGQGALTAARVLCGVFVRRGHDVVSGQLHGMAQRGGSVQSSVLIDTGISPVIGAGQADCVLGFEPVETARALSLMSKNTTVYMNTCAVVPFVVGQQLALTRAGAGYPAVKDLIDCLKKVAQRVFSFDAMQRAFDAGSPKALNMVMLGCLLGSEALPCTADEFWTTTLKTMPSKLKQINTAAFFAGVEWAREVGNAAVEASGS